jgi:alkylation response protein AidB-like acyl-CoA dehydrogenase
VLGGPSATDYLVVARTSGSIDEPNGITLFRVPRTAAGLTVRDYRMIDSSGMSDLVLDEVQVPAEVIVGAMSAALSLTTDHLCTRKQFGGPLRDFQVLRHRAADMVVDLEQARSAAYRGLAGCMKQILKLAPTPLRPQRSS